MSSEMFVFENSYFSDPFFTFTDSSTIDHPHPQLPFEILQEIQENKSSDLIQESSCSNPVDETSSLDQIASILLSSSPPSFKLESLSLSHLRNVENSGFEGKTEECQLKFDSFSGYNNSFLHQSFDSAYENAVKFMQRSYSSNSFENKQNFSFQPQFDSVLQNQMLSSPEGSFPCSQIRRVCSTGDLQNVKINMQKTNMLSSSPLSMEKLFTEEANFKVGRYSAEEKRERIDRYRAKRTQRNFNKTIKYACRKTLADNRPRIRGRFARNDEAGEIPKASMFHRFEDEDDLLIDGFHDEDDEGNAQESFFNSISSIQYQNYSY